MHCRKSAFSLMASGTNKKGGVNCMKITISSDLIERMETEEDGYCVSRIPGRQKAEALIQEAGAKLPTEEELQEENEGLINGVEFALDNGISVSQEDMEEYRRLTDGKKCRRADRKTQSR